MIGRVRRYPNWSEFVFTIPAVLWVDKIGRKTKEDIAGLSSFLTCQNQFSIDTNASIGGIELSYSVVHSGQPLLSVTPKREKAIKPLKIPCQVTSSIITTIALATHPLATNRPAEKPILSLRILSDLVPSSNMNCPNQACKKGNVTGRTHCEFCGTELPGSMYQPIILEMRTTIACEQVGTNQL
ncbi:unnamed protein product [Penicillium roqueforti FM164]|uniref:Uncharacterized protein n=1 Tax=Penicillium roqueforti (strain FM164) TaxID=1365484 RepID=W6QJX3_PENRF|nr:unnamed protein product [Penicillium roqueforti FM164]